MKVVEVFKEFKELFSVQEEQAKRFTESTTKHAEKTRVLTPESWKDDTIILDRSVLED